MLGSVLNLPAILSFLAAREVFSEEQDTGQQHSQLWYKNLKEVVVLH